MPGPCITLLVTCNCDVITVCITIPTKRHHLPPCLVTWLLTCQDKHSCHITSLVHSKIAADIQSKGTTMITVTVREAMPGPWLQYEGSCCVLQPVWCHVRIFLIMDSGTWSQESAERVRAIDRGIGRTGPARDAHLSVYSKCNIFCLVTLWNSSYHVACWLIIMACCSRPYPISQHLPCFMIGLASLWHYYSQSI